MERDERWREMREMERDERCREMYPLCNLKKNAVHIVRSK